MSIHRSSYYKTSLLAVAVAGVLIAAGAAVALVLPSYASTALIAACVAATPALFVGLAGCLVIYRDTRLMRGLPDLFVVLNRSRNETALSGESVAGMGWRKVLRVLTFRKPLIVGEWVTIRSFAEIARTLDAADAVDGLPFLPEMQRFCGTRARVYRRVDKIYDYGGKKNLRRLRNAVLLKGLRCDGSAHDGCQAACYMIWKEDWLRRDGASESAPGAAESRPFQPQRTTDASGVTRYTCQFTQLVKSSTTLHPRDLRQDLRPVLAGNLTVPAALVAWLTRTFNRVQIWRGGIGFPPIPVGKSSATPVVSLNLQPGDAVRVRDIDAIGATLDQKSKNRGLWFDSDMVKHCQQPHKVLQRVDRIIDDANGLMRTMKTPCIVLDGIAYSGEGLRFCFQEDPTFWREAWLSPTQSSSQESTSQISSRPIAIGGPPASE